MRTTKTQIYCRDMGIYGILLLPSPALLLFSSLQDKKGSELSMHLQVWQWLCQRCCMQHLPAIDCISAPCTKHNVELSVKDGGRKNAQDLWLKPWAHGIWQSGKKSPVFHEYGVSNGTQCLPASISHSSLVLYRSTLLKTT